MVVKNNEPRISHERLVYDLRGMQHAWRTLKPDTVLADATFKVLDSKGTPLRLAEFGDTDVQVQFTNVAHEKGNSFMAAVRNSNGELIEILTSVEAFDGLLQGTDAARLVRVEPHEREAQIAMKEEIAWLRKLLAIARQREHLRTLGGRLSAAMIRNLLAEKASVPSAIPAHTETPLGVEPEPPVSRAEESGMPADYIKKALNEISATPISSEDLRKITVPWATDSARRRVLLHSLLEGKSIGLASRSANADFDEVFKAASHWRDVFFTKNKKSAKDALIAVLLQLEREQLKTHAR